MEHEREVVVAERREVAAGVVSLRLADPTGAALPGWEPGAHIDLVLPGGLVRQYSLCGSPGDTRTWRIAVLREPGGRGGSAAVHDTVAEGSLLAVRGPRNHFRLHDARRYLFLAGGIGITPILPMLAAATAAGRDWTLYYGGRSRRSMAFIDELAAYGGRVVLVPEDEAGLLPLAGLTGDAVYCCGPPGLLAAAEARWPTGLHLERFTATASTGGPRRPIEVVCARSRRRLLVPADRSILEVAEEAGLDPASSCTEGICGSCETAVLEGEPEHLDDLLTEQERAAGNTMLICVSRARTPRLVLDL